MPMATITRTISIGLGPSTGFRSIGPSYRHSTSVRTRPATGQRSMRDTSPDRPDPGGTATVAKVTMPQLGESVAEGTIGKWLKQPGDTVEKYEPLARGHHRQGQRRGPVAVRRRPEGDPRRGGRDGPEQRRDRGDRDGRRGLGRVERRRAEGRRAAPAARPSPLRPPRQRPRPAARTAAAAPAARPGRLRRAPGARRRVAPRTGGRRPPSPPTPPATPTPG